MEKRTRLNLLTRETHNGLTQIEKMTSYALFLPAILVKIAAKIIRLCFVF